MNSWKALGGEASSRIGRELLRSSPHALSSAEVAADAPGAAGGVR